MTPVSSSNSTSTLNNNNGNNVINNTTCPICFEDFTTDLISPDGVASMPPLSPSSPLLVPAPADDDEDRTFNHPRDATDKVGVDDKMTHSPAALMSCNAENENGDHLPDVDIELGQVDETPIANEASEMDSDAVVRVVLLTPQLPQTQTPEQMDAIGSCGHNFCRDCLYQHCVYAIQAKQVPISCPHLQESASASAINVNWESGSRSAKQAAASSPTTTHVVACESLIPRDIVQSVILYPQHAAAAQLSPPFVPTNDANDNSKLEQERLWMRYEKLIALAENSNLIECPQCDGLLDVTTCQQQPQQPPDGDVPIAEPSTTNLEQADHATLPIVSPLTASAAAPPPLAMVWGPNDLSCPSCHGTVCRLHGTAHVGTPCSQYIAVSILNSPSHTNMASPASSTTSKRSGSSFLRGKNVKQNSPDSTATTMSSNSNTSSSTPLAAEHGVAGGTTGSTNPDELLTMRTLAAWTKPCSHCGCHLQKAAGCDHVICPSCRQDLCWRCGTHVHLTGHVVRHCAQCQRDYRDHRYDHVYRFRLALCLPVLLPLFMVYSIILMAVATATGCFCGCFRCGRCLVLQSKPQQQQQQQGTANTATTTTARAAAPSSVAPPKATSTSSPTTNMASAAPSTTAVSLGPTSTGSASIALGEATNNRTNSSGAAATAATQSPLRLHGNTRHGVWATIVVVFLPVIALLEDFGFHVPILDELFPEPLTNTEMPYMEVEMNTL